MGQGEGGSEPDAEGDERQVDLCSDTSEHRAAASAARTPANDCAARAQHREILVANEDSRHQTAHTAALRPPVTTPIKKVWIETGCISCKVCQDIAPKVFRVEDGMDCVVQPDAAVHFGKLRDDIEQAARDCPVEVIKIEHAG
jgi:ferredoxin